MQLFLQILFMVIRTAVLDMRKQVKYLCQVLCLQNEKKITQGPVESVWCAPEFRFLVSHEEFLAAESLVHRKCCLCLVSVV